MLKILISLLMALSLTTYAKDTTMNTIYDINVKTIDGKETTLEVYKGKVMLIVNVASECGFTSQYDGLEALYKKYKEQGLVVLGFPCNQFGSQEPGTEAEIQNFCRVNFGVTFPMFSKLNVNGDDTHPLYVYLKSEKSGILTSESIKWNFTKFLVNKRGKVVDRFGSFTKPKELEKEIEALLK
ncbi:MAG: Glutathione peroxidase family protein [uncultured Sulfurovum sp.]|uniref:Glutathione peroxidase n=1 Tax=uncultured Sulfurovum sp. TaxID=269237 RepID=A0A6S6TRT9_9BACT|nr:MAG: Glutathione peroxidase family protein [uncultured Sulfurovum sp.]